jgi:hypothetical protein
MLGGPKARKAPSPEGERILADMVAHKQRHQEARLDTMRAQEKAEIAFQRCMGDLGSVPECNRKLQRDGYELFNLAKIVSAQKEKEKVIE